MVVPNAVTRTPPNTNVTVAVMSVALAEQGQSCRTLPKEGWKQANLLYRAYPKYVFTEPKAFGKLHSGNVGVGLYRAARVRQQAVRAVHGCGT